jgi:hypothetical protein
MLQRIADCVVVLALDNFDVLPILSLEIVGKLPIHDAPNACLTQIAVLVVAHPSHDMRSSSTLDQHNLVTWHFGSGETFGKERLGHRSRLAGFFRRGLLGCVGYLAGA